MDKKEDIFNKIFGSMLNENKEESMPPLEGMFDYEENEHSYEEKVEKWLNTEMDYVPEFLNDPDYIKHIEKAPLPPLSREDEFSASTLGLQELRKTKKYIKEMHKAISVQLRKVYVTYPLLLEKHYEEALMRVQEEMFKAIEDLEHFVAGDIDKMERIKQDWQLFQEFQEKRLKLLHKIHNFYDESK